MKRSFLVVMAAGLLIMFTSCNFGSLGYARELQKTLSERYEAEKVEVSIHNTELRVSLRNSPLEDLSSEEKSHLAREIGSLALELEERPRLETGKLVFEDNTALGVANISTSDSFDMYLEEIHIPH